MRRPARHRRPVTRYATATIITVLALAAVITAGAALTDTPERTSHRPPVMPGPAARGQ